MNTRFTSLCFALAALLIGSLGAQAADLPQPSYKAPAYVGPVVRQLDRVLCRYQRRLRLGRFGMERRALATSRLRQTAGWAACTAGYNIQTGTWVWGIEGDFDYADLNGTATVCGGCTVKDTWLGTARARLGYAGWNNWLPYITGGGAFGNIKANSRARRQL